MIKIIPFWRRLIGARRANVAMMFGLALVPTAGLFGLAIDYGGATTAKSRLDIALDAASLAATTYVSNAVAQGQSDAVSAAQKQAISVFNAQAGMVPWTTLSSVTATVTSTNGNYTANVAYKGAFQTSFGGLFGVSTISMSNSATTKLSTNPYADIHVLLDVSSSMGIAATATDIAKMIALTTAFQPNGPLPGNVSKGEGCAFGCHWSTTYTDYYKLASQNGVTLRIDVLRGALGNLITSMTTLNTSGLFRLGLYTFNQNLATIYKLSTNISGATTALPSVTLDINNCSNNCPESYFNNAISGMGTTIGTSGDGSSQAASRKYLFIITDGLVDQYTGNSRVIGQIDATQCNAMKSKGVTIMVLYTTYLPLPTNAFYNTYVAPIQNQISPALQNCASAPSLFFTASDSAGINTALQTMLANAAKSPGHFTQ